MPLLRKDARRRWRARAAVFAMIALAEAVYFRPAILRGTEALAGSDYLQLHMARMAFAEDNLFGPRHALPAWSPRELMGAPFAANLQSFPWIPTRFPLLLFPPEFAYGPGVAIAVMLAAAFTYLFCRRAGFSEIAAAASGWTFACAGYFASRVLAGHLPLLEAYPALPLLLWLADRALDGRRRDIAWLAIASGAVALAGHPQVPAYALAATLVYVLWRGRGWLRARLAAAIALGSALSLAAWWPMLLLIGKSTRVLPLDPPGNDIALPYRRILAFINPGIDGWPASMHPAAGNVFSGYPNLAYFYDTVGYAGLAPLLAIVLLAVLACFGKRHFNGRLKFVAAIGMLAFLGALPLVEPAHHLLPALIFRSPARLLYLTTFSLAAALGAAVDALLSWRPGARLGYAAVAVLLGLHGLDLGGFSRRFAATVPTADLRDSEERLAGLPIGDQRIACDYSYWSSLRRFDDIGTFDSLLLAKPYTALLALSGAPPRLNVQVVNGATLALAALQAGGVTLVLTPFLRADLEPVGKHAGLNVYRVPGTAPRAAFYGSQPGSSSTAVYQRPSSDEIGVQVAAGAAGFVNVLEAYDPGWSAEQDGHPSPVFAANGFTLATQVAAGNHAVRFRYRTPGRAVGTGLTILAGALLAWLLYGIPEAW